MAVKESRITLVLLIVTASLAATVVESEESVFTLWVTYFLRTETFKFDETKFNTFYNHLCNEKSGFVRVYRNDRLWVSVIRNETHTSRQTENHVYSRRYRCKRDHTVWVTYNWYYNDYYLDCERLQVSDDYYCISTNKCWSLHLNNPTTAPYDLNTVEIIWVSYQVINVTHNERINIANCVAPCNAITTTSTPTTPITTKSANTTTKTNPSSSASSTIRVSTTVSETSLTPPTNATTAPSNAFVSEQGSGNATATIIGVVVSLVVVAAVLAVLGVLYWRRRRKAATSAKSIKNSSTANTPYSVALHNDRTDDNQIRYPYATIEPSGAVVPSRTEDPSYYNQDALASTRGPQSLVVGDHSKMPEHDSPDYYNLNDGQSGSTDANTTAVTTSLNGVARSNYLGNGYSTAVDTSSDVGGTYYYSAVNRNNNDNAALISTTPNTTDHGGNTGNTEYAFANPVVSDTKNEYSKLHDPVRNIKDPYNVLAAADDKGNQKTASAPSSSTSQAPSAYSLAQPFLEKTKPPVEVIDVGHSSKEPHSDVNPQTSSELSTRSDQAGNKVTPAHRKKDKANFVVTDSKDGAASAPGGRRNEYFELESNYDSDASETDGKEISDPYSEIDGVKDGAVNPYDEYTI